MSGSKRRIRICKRGRPCRLLPGVRKPQDGLSHNSSQPRKGKSSSFLGASPCHSNKSSVEIPGVLSTIPPPVGTSPPRASSSRCANKDGGSPSPRTAAAQPPTEEAHRPERGDTSHTGSRPDQGPELREGLSRTGLRNIRIILVVVMAMGACIAGISLYTRMW